DDEKQAPKEAVFVGAVDLRFGGMGAVGQTVVPATERQKLTRPPACQSLRTLAERFGLPSSAAIFRFIMRRHGVWGSMTVRKWIQGTVLLLAAAVAGEAQQAKATAPPQSHQKALEPARAPGLPIDGYIRDAWKTLERSMTSCTSVVDPKVNTAPI